MTVEPNSAHNWVLFGPQGGLFFLVFFVVVVVVVNSKQS